MSDRPAGIVLAGGRSRRLGTDKALVRFGDYTLLALTVEKLVPLCQQVLIVSNSPGEHSHPAARVVPDLFPGKGSLGGVYSGLSMVQTNRALTVACDMPFLNPQLLTYMASMAEEWDVVIPRRHNKLEPLHAVYARTCLPHMRRLLDAGNLKIIDFFPDVRVRYVDESELAPWDPDGRSFFNINTPQDLAAARLLLPGGP